MTDTETPTTASHEEEPRGDRLPLWLRLLGGVGLAALLVAVYAIVQITGNDDSTAAAPALPGAPLTSGEPLRAGDAAPDIEVPTLDGDVFSLRDHLASDGRPVFVNMWAEWCIPCRSEMPAIEAASVAHPEVRFVGVVIRDQEAPVRRFVDDYGITYDIGFDVERAVEDDYLVWAMPSTYLIGSDGIIIERLFGPMSDSQLEGIVAEAVAAANEA